MQQRSVVTGTAGIGKTFFALYAARTYFDRGEFVVLYYNTRVWAFSKKSPTELQRKSGEYLQLDADLRLIKGKQPNGNEFWYKVLEEEMFDFHECLRQWRRCGSALIIRDPGDERREIYTVSAGQTEFFAVLRKTLLEESAYIRSADLWRGEELLYALKLGLIWPDVRSLDADYVMEGFRRYGGSARSALVFANKLRQKQISKDNIEMEPLPNSTVKSIQILAEQQVIGQEEMTKAKSLLFHHTPVDDTYRIHFASFYMGEQLMENVIQHGSKALSTVVAALSIEENHQDAYGSLFEQEVHKRLSQYAFITKNITLLGCHPPSLKKGIIRAKAKVSLEFSRASIVSFPGHSLEIIGLEATEEPMDIYFHPITTDFPTYDSFLLCPASTFFCAEGDDNNNKKKEIEASSLLVGLQMTVTANGHSGDKPSHTMYAVHLKNAIQDMKKSMGKSHPRLKILDEVVTIFISPTESCRKMEFMPILTNDKNELTKSMENISGITPQYSAIFEATMIEQLLLRDNDPYACY